MKKGVASAISHGLHHGMEGREPRSFKIQPWTSTNKPGKKTEISPLEGGARGAASSNSAAETFWPISTGWGESLKAPAIARSDGRMSLQRIGTSNQDSCREFYKSFRQRCRWEYFGTIREVHHFPISPSYFSASESTTKPKLQRKRQ